MAAILIAEDESRIASFVEKGLRAAGHTTAVAATGNDALEMALSDDFELLVLDIGLPGLNGFEVLEQLRGQGFTLPVIILTARDSVTDTVAGLDSGADDYMAKPFRIEELLARIRIRLRQIGSAEPAALSHGDLSLDLHTRLATVGGRSIELSAREFSLLETLLRNPGQVMTREQLLSRVWGYDFDPGSNVVDVYIRYLRNKIGADRILTVRGAGYRLVT
ncbi:response regulator transcription factor [Microlunatus speluncae]|uniref:response regulator transcription factor n=1 Tax=Microlunatus speluncae TaxID=2594267 RepID=UPI0012665DC4|nr:response regulator transcription factor [Microlunatus speluncae]